MKEKLPHRRYCAQDYGGQLFIKMKINTANNATFVIGLENQTDGMIFPYTHK
jgi:hypothetical protein